MMRVAGVFAASLVVTACARNSAAIPLPSNKPLARAAAGPVLRLGFLMGGVRPDANRATAPLALKMDTQPLTYITETIDDDVAVYDRAGVRLGEVSIPQEPVGIMVDRHHNLWASSCCNPGLVLEFARGGTSPIRTLGDASGSPNDVTICPDGTVYVADDSDRNSAIEIYASGNDEPTGRLTYRGSGNRFSFITCDAAGNVFASVNRAFSGFVVGYPGGSQNRVYSLGVHLAGAGGIKADNAGNLIVADFQDGTVAEYTERGRPTGRVVQNTNIYDVALTQDGRVIGGGIGALNAHADSYTFPGGRHRQRYRDLTYPMGFAFDPGQSWSGPKDDAL